jgi:hypothetical protein
MQIFVKRGGEFRPAAVRIQIFIPENQSTALLGRPLLRD